MNIFGKLSKDDSDLIEQVIQLDLEQMDFPWRKTDWVDLDWENHQLFTMRNDLKQILGFALFHHLLNDHTAHLLKICITDNFRGSGIAEELFEKSFLELSHRGANSVYLEVEEENARAKSFYRKLGFQLIRVVYGYYSNGKSALTMLMTR